ncbi:MAG TPA: LLM class F420-dependent oxidoreductase [Acidimicrobiales bacterium]|nr:LLM class F420-dependent oxidoreductase [Acidimicrobiales bacterium]
MRIATQVGYAGDVLESIRQLPELERAGCDMVWVAEAYSLDAPSTMGYIAAITERMEVAAGILPLYSRTPTLIAMTAAGIDYLSNGRCVLGLGASGPQVIEGWHGLPYDRPIGRTREIVDICRQVWRRERIDHDGRSYTIPLPPEQGTGLGKPLKIINRPVRERIPVYIASLGAKNVEMTAELAEGWLPILFVPEKADEVWGEPLAKGMANRAPDLGPLDIAAGGLVAIGDDLEGLRDFIRPYVALYVGGMGAKGRNFYNDLAKRYGFEKEAEVIQDLYLSGKKDEAAAAVPAELLELTSLVGPPGYIKERLAAYKEAGVTVLNTTVVSDDPVRTMAQLRELVDAV